VIAQAGQTSRHNAPLAAEPVSEMLPNGLRVLVVPQTHLQGATLGLFIKVGPRYERRESNGISHFLEHMLFRGTRHYASAYDLTFAAEAMGGTLDAATYADFTHYQISVPSEHASAALTLLADLLAGPRFTDLALEKQIVREEILGDLDEDGREVDPENLSRMLMFGSHPLGFKITGDADNVDSFTTEHLRAHLTSHYGASNMAMVATGAVDAEAIIAQSRSLFGELPRGRVTLVEAPPPPRTGQRISFVKNDSSQSDARLLFRAFGSDDPDFTALKLLVRVLDDGMSTRLHRRLTDDTGLAYDVFAALDPYEETGLLEVGASVEHDKLPSLLQAALQLLSELRDGEVSEAELDKAKGRYRWTLRRIIDSPEEMAVYVGTQAVFGRRANLSELLAEVDSITPDRLKAVARRVIRPEDLCVLCVGKHQAAREKTCREVIGVWSRANGLL
jgi:predicted Zn-dependent peptidase